MAEAPKTLTFDAARVEAFLERLAEMAASRGESPELPISDAHDELDAIAYAFNELLGELRFASDARAKLEAERLAQATAMADFEQRRADQLRLAKERADEANRAKTAFLRTISHELRTPVTVLIGSAELLARRELGEADRRELARRFLRGARQLLGLLDNVLDIAKIEAGRLDPRTVVFSPAAVADEVRLTFEAQAAEKGLRLTVDAASAAGPVLGDAQRVRQIVFNLVSNAVKYTAAGEVRLRALVEETPEGPDLRVSVSDTGPGIAAEDRPLLFSPFGRTPGAAGIDGTGLGLHLSSRLAEALGGELRLAWSEKGEGSRFELRLPVEPAPEAAPGGEAPGQTQLAGVSVLLADDNQDIRTLFTQLLEAEGAAVTAVADGAAALHLAQTRDYHVVLMDVHMPVLSGLEAARRLREAGYAKPLVALTADVARGHRDECLEAGFSQFVAKPVDYDEFIAVIRAATQSPAQ